MTLTLRPMTDSELAGRLPVLTDSYSDDLSRSRGLPADRARVDAERQIADLLPAGVRTDGALLRTGVVEGEPVGWIWIALPGSAGQRDMAWIYNIEVDPDHRGKGYGRALMRAAEVELVALGVTKLGLNVFGDNTVAMGLYASLGFRVTAQQMAKELS